MIKVMDPYSEKSSLPQSKVGIVGTFDVENYGDLLFPLMAEAAFKLREQSIQLFPFSPNLRSERHWPFRVYPTGDIPDFLPGLSALLIGGGQIVRFDKCYPIPVPDDLTLPIAYWLIPAALGAIIGKPVVWNAVGVWTGSPPAPWYDELVNTVLQASYLVGVRDSASRIHLAKTAPNVNIQLVPDTAFSLSRFWPLERESEEYRNWRQSLGIGSPYVVVQASRPIANYISTIETVMEKVATQTVVVLPICWCHGDRADGFLQMAGSAIDSPEWLSPRLISEIIGRAELVIASSLHACITGLSYGVPVIRVPGSNASDRKFELLDQFAGIASIEDPPALAKTIHRGRKIEPLVTGCIDRLDLYWDQVVDVVLNPLHHTSNRATSMLLSQFSVIIGKLEVAARTHASTATTTGSG